MTALPQLERRARVVVLLANPENRRLLADALADRYEVFLQIDSVLGDDSRGPFDLCIIDDVSVRQYARQLERLRRTYDPVYLPVLMLADRRAVEPRGSGLWDVVDDVLLRPVERMELASRVRALLRTRALSLRAQKLSDLYEHERTIAQRLQDGAVPRGLPQLAGLQLDAVYRPADDAARVGGDWYDVLRLPDGRVVVTIGDVSGSGLDAAVTMSQMRQVLRAVANVHSDPALMLDAAERTLVADESHRELSCFVGVVDLVTEELTFAGAGHPPPLLREASGATQALPCDGLLLGTSVRLPRASQTIAFPHDATLVLYTDGVTEGERDPLGGERRLVEYASALDANEASPAISLANAMRVSNATDDVALLTVKQTVRTATATIHRRSFDARDSQAARAMQRDFRALLEGRRVATVAIVTGETIFAELLGNVVRHAGGCVEVVVDLEAQNPVLNVLDRGTGFQHFPKLPHDLLSERGRGLFIVSQLAEEFSVQRRTGGGSHARVVLKTSA